MPTTNYPNEISLGGVSLLDTYAGNVFWVDSGTGSDIGSAKGTKQKPYATLEYALDKCTAGNGDIIMVYPGHAETLTVGFTLDTAGVSVIGLGNGDNRPTLTINAAIDGVSISGDDCLLHNFRIIAGSSVAVGTRLMSFTTASDVIVSGCKFEMAYVMYHMIYIKSGDNIKIKDCEFFNTITTAANDHPQRCLINDSGTNVVVSHCRFKDTEASKTELWATIVNSGVKTGSMQVEDCTFICRGVATNNRAGDVSDFSEWSPNLSTLFCRAISPSSNTAAGSIFIGTAQYMVECYDVAVVNIAAAVAPTAA
jgi:hypothetical protein